MFLAGEYPRDMDEESSRVKINALIHSGITVFIDLTDKNDNLLPYAYLLETALHQRFPIRDVSIPDSTDITVSIFLPARRLTSTDPHTLIMVLF